MALIKTLLGKTPLFGENCFLTENATIVGDVIMGNDCSVWYNAVLGAMCITLKLATK